MATASLKPHHQMTRWHHGKELAKRQKGNARWNEMHRLMGPVPVVDLTGVVRLDEERQRRRYPEGA